MPERVTVKAGVRRLAAAAVLACLWLAFVLHPLAAHGTDHEAHSCVVCALATAPALLAAVLALLGIVRLGPCSARVVPVFENAPLRPPSARGPPL